MVDEELKEQLREVKKELDKINEKINRLIVKKNELSEQKGAIKDKICLSQSLKLAEADWTNQFSWSSEVDKALNNVFKLRSFRAQQLKTINAIMSKENVILLAPTGGGKSLCFQLPAIISEGLTVVISPLISLMEDQVWAMKKLGIHVELLCSTTDKTHANAVLKMLITEQTSLKLLYVTPERFAKSKRFMSNLQKCYLAHKLDRIAIDEVHCCSCWGHDFRPDYKYLGNLRQMFPDVPILGVTATATTKVIIDVQKMLNIQNCVVLRAPFNRPNLYYHVVDKPADKIDNINILADLLQTRYKDESGIIYTFSIKDADDIALGLMERGLKVKAYHANLVPTRRTKIHSDWKNGRTQVVVATVAFGMGIDKPDVRFVIHHTLSKSIENFYQESGRAGRDGERAECILMYRLKDLFRISTMMFTEHTGLKNAYAMVDYCINRSKCRRQLISTHFAEVWNSLDCDNMCDFCLNPDRISSTKIDIYPYYNELLNIIEHASTMDIKLTGLKLIDAWYHKGPSNLRLPKSKPPTINRSFAETILAFLIIKDYLKEDFHFTAFATNSYIIRGPLCTENKCIDFYISKIQKLPLDKIYSKDIEFVSEEKLKKHKKKKKSKTKRSPEELNETIISSSEVTTSTISTHRKRRKLHENSINSTNELEFSNSDDLGLLSPTTSENLSSNSNSQNKNLSSTSGSHAQLIISNVRSTSTLNLTPSRNSSLHDRVSQLIEEEISIREELENNRNDENNTNDENNINEEYNLNFVKSEISNNDVILITEKEVIIEID